MGNKKSKATNHSRGVAKSKATSHSRGVAKSKATSHSRVVATSEQTSTHSKCGVGRDQINVPMVQNVLLIWLDNKIDDNNADYHNTITQLRCAVNIINKYTDDEECIKFLKTIDNEKVCVVISGSFGEYIVPRIHNMSQVDSIFIFSDNRKYHEQWPKEWPKIKDVFTEIASLCKALKETAQECEQNAMSISFMSTNDDVSKKNLNKLDPPFMYTQILKEMLLTIKFEDKHITEFIQYCRNALVDNENELKNVKKLEEKYRDETPIFWYTYECFLYPMLNRTLRLLDVDLIIRMGFFISDLHRHIEQLYKEQFDDQNSDKTFTVYRGQGMTKTEFEKMAKTKGGLLSFNCFLSTSKARDVCLGIAHHAATNPDLVGVLFVMTIDPTKSTAPFASIKDVSYFKDKGDEVLFPMHTVFRIYEITLIGRNYRLFQVELTCTSDNDNDLRALTDRIRKETYPNEEGWIRLGLVLLKMGQSQEAQHFYEILLEQTTEERKKRYIYQLLGDAKHRQGAYQEAITFYEKAHEIDQKILPPTHFNLAMSYKNIGGMYYKVGEYAKALSSYEKAIEILKQSLPPNHPDLAASYSNIGLVYHNMGEYSKALSSHSKALDIRRESLPPNHLDLAISYHNIGAAYCSMGEYLKALEYYEKALEIRKQSLPSNHSDLATSYIAQGNVYNLMGKPSEAIVFYKNALKIQQQSLPPNHPDLTACYNNLGSVYNTMREYPKALSYYEKDLEISEKVLPLNHPDLAMSYSNIGNVYFNMSEYSKALSFYERAVNIGQQSLSPNHPHLQTYEKNLDKVKTKL